MDITFVLDYLVGLAPWVKQAFMALGSIVVIGTAVDSVVPDEKDGGFMAKAMALPVVGSVLNALKRFSPFNIRPKE